MQARVYDKQTWDLSCIRKEERRKSWVSKSKNVVNQQIVGPGGFEELLDVLISLNLHKKKPQSMWLKQQTFVSHSSVAWEV